MHSLLALAARFALGSWRDQRRRLVASTAVFGFVAVMLVMIIAALLAAFAIWIGQIHGAVVGCLSAAALASVLAGIALAINAIFQSVARSRARRRSISPEMQSVMLVAIPAILSRRSMPVLIGAALAGFFAASAIRRGRASRDDDGD